MNRGPKDYGYDHTTHHLISIKEAPDSLVALRNELALPGNKDIFDLAIQAQSFEEALGTIGATLDIALDGYYDVADLCDVLTTALRKRHLHGNQPHMRDKRLVNAELVETRGEVTLETVEDEMVNIVGNDKPAQLELELKDIPDDTRHFCFWPQCLEIIPEQHLACQNHWWTLSGEIRYKLYVAKTRGTRAELEVEIASALAWAKFSKTYEDEEKQRGRASNLTPHQEPLAKE